MNTRERVKSLLLPIERGERKTEQGKQEQSALSTLFLKRVTLSNYTTANNRVLLSLFILYKLPAINAGNIMIHPSFGGL